MAEAVEIIEDDPIAVSYTHLRAGEKVLLAGKRALCCPGERPAGGGPAGGLSRGAAPGSAGIRGLLVPALDGI